MTVNNLIDILGAPEAAFVQVDGPAGQPGRNRLSSMRVETMVKAVRSPFFPLCFRPLNSALAQVSGLFLGGCSTSPAQNMFGSFFPAWMMCAAAGIIIAIILRQAFGAIGVNQYLIAPPLTYLSIAVAGTLLVWLLVFGH